MPKTRKIEYQRTISQELYNAWLRLKRKGDSSIIAKELKVSRPVVDRALLYGYVAQMRELPDLINKFFHDRMEDENKSARKLVNMADAQGK